MKANCKCTEKEENVQFPISNNKLCAVWMISNL